jgi:hypothetical protein
MAAACQTPAVPETPEARPRRAAYQVPRRLPVTEEREERAVTKASRARAAPRAPEVNPAPAGSQSRRQLSIPVMSYISVTRRLLSTTYAILTKSV